MEHQHLFSLGLFNQVPVEQREEPLHLGVKDLAQGCRHQYTRPMRGNRWGRQTLRWLMSLTSPTRRLSSLRMALAATPVVALLKSCIHEGRSTVSRGEKRRQKTRRWTRDSVMWWVTNHGGVPPGAGGLDLTGRGSEEVAHGRRRCGFGRWGGVRWWWWWW